MDKLESIRSFVEVARIGSFTQAAEHLGISRIKVSRHINEVEAWLNLRLLHRTTRRVSLTAPGQEALLRCEQILNQAAALESQALLMNTELVGSVRVAAPIGLGQNLLFDLVESFTRLHPRVRIHLLLSDRFAQLVEERVDVALRFVAQPDENLIARRLMQVDSVVCASPEYLQRNGSPAEPIELSRHNCLTHLDVERWTFSVVGQVLEVTVRGNLSANDVSVLLKGAVRGAGVALLPCDLANPYLENGALVALLKDFPTYSLPIWAVYISRSYQQPIVRAFIDFIADHWKGHMTAVTGNQLINR